VTRARALPRIVVTVALLVALPAGRSAARDKAAGPVSWPQQDVQSSLSVMDALELYELGDPEVIKLVATPRQIGSIELELIKGAPAWIKANGPREAPRRRLVAATFAIEAARHGLETIDGWRSLTLMEWASTELRVDRTPLPAERFWRIAVVAMLADWLGQFPVTSITAGETPLTWFEKHLGFSEQRFPKDPRWLMARAFITELRAIQSFLQRPLLEGKVLIPNDVVLLYEAAAKTPAVEAEANIRLGYIWLTGGEPDRAIDLLTRAATSTDENDLQYLAHLIRGWALTRLGRHGDAVAAFRRAHESQKDGQTAVLWLANGLFLQGQREEAVSLIDGSLKSATETDPWHVYYRGPFRLWPSMIQQLREAIR